MTRFALLPVALLLGGCIPYPHFDYYVPAVTGVVAKDGAAVVGAAVTVKSGMNSTVRSAVTDPSGRFVTTPIRKFRFFAPMLGDPFYSYEIRIKVGEDSYKGYSVGGIGYSPATLQVDCNLSQPDKALKEPIYCKATGHTD